MNEWDVPYWRNPWAFHAEVLGYVCRIGRHSRGSSREVRVVGAVVAALIRLGTASRDIAFEYRLTASERVDVAVPSRGLFIECKGTRITPGALRQGVRYLTAARLQWPDPRVILVAPSVDRTLTPPAGITTAEIRPAEIGPA